MTWIGACLVAAFLLGALLGSVFSRQREDAKQDQSHTGKLDYPTETDQEASIAALARTQIAVAKDSHAAAKDNATHNERSRRIGFWTAIGVGVYTVFTAVIVVFSVVQYGDTHRFNKKQRQFFADQVGIMRGQLDEMRAEQRPWLFAPSIVLTEQVIRDVNGIQIPLGFVLTNSGHLPASNVHVNLLARGTHLYHLTQYAAAERENCNQPLEFIGFSVFPNFTTQLPVSWTTSISNEEISTAAKDFAPELKRLWPMILACVVYRDPSGIDHHTPYILELVAIANGVRSPLIPSEADELSKSHIILQQSVTTGMPPD
jgi:hypothetical protein